ncbi:MAG: efflux RND transporter periplasmic adaptor subunit [Verrucomicrobiota bacterium]
MQGKGTFKDKLAAFWANKKARWISIGVAAFIFVSIIAVIVLSPVKEAELGRVIRDNAVAVVYGTITVEPVYQVLVKARSTGVVREIVVNEGDEVKKDEILAKIKDEEDGTSLEETLVDLESAKKRFTIGPTSANELVVKKQELQRIEPLVRDGLIAPLELARIKSQVEDLERRVAQEKLDLEQAVAIAETKFQNSKNKIEQGVIRSPINGEVLEMFTRLGEATLNQTQLFVVGSKNTHLVAVVNEEDVGAIEKGMSAIVRLYSYDNQDFEAKVEKVLKQAQNQSFEVILKMNNPPDELLSGMTGEVNIIVGSRNNTLMVPTRAIRQGNLLYVVRNGKVRIQKVSTGYRNIDFCEILDGVREGEAIIISDQDKYNEGDRVKPM